MKTKLTNSDLIALVRIQHAINNILSHNSKFGYDAYDNQLLSILNAIELFFIDHVYDNHSSLAIHRKIQENFDKLLDCSSYDEYVHFLHTIFSNK